MSDKKSNPPRPAIWFLQNLCPGDNEALTGDLIERFHQGRTRSWFWKQVVIIVIIRILGEIRRHWPHLFYAIAGTALPALLSRAVKGLPFALHWWVLPWPWSQLVLELSPIALLAIAALPALAAGLVINEEFRWLSLLRTGVINLALIMLGKYLLEVFPSWLSLPVPGNVYHRVLMIPGVLRIMVFFSTFFVAAWLGCTSLRLRPTAFLTQRR